ncbi:hypothetical protein K7X08_031523 [Anisodus acutangulus]|uniref:Pentatricopeptide repeat-containing protein n=1 Tax=Anisodus acutangulus TaxID=402998 RepID=A0A9Q1MLT8_9SOLA|nr:hypothetical protein K7X08_031523 [Anisodus acutangulus]
MHCLGLKIGVETDIYVVTSLLTMYLNCGYCVSATRLFEFVENKNVVCYNAFISGLLQNGAEEVVLDVFKQMLLDEEPNEVTIISVLSGIANLKNVKFGRQVHGFIVKIELQCHTMVGTALVDMYSKCGFWLCAYGVFKELGGNRNLITWNSMISGMMLNEQTEKAVELFAGLDSEGLKPDSATWNSMIIGFSQLQKEAEAFTFFRKMLSAGVVPASEHFSNAKMAEEMTEKLSELEPQNPVPFVILYNLYARQGRWDDAERIRETIDERGLEKLPGYSTVGLALIFDSDHCPNIPCVRKSKIDVKDVGGSKMKQGMRSLSSSAQLTSLTSPPVTDPVN